MKTLEKLNLELEDVRSKITALDNDIYLLESERAKLINKNRQICSEIRLLEIKKHNIQEGNLYVYENSTCFHHDEIFTLLKIIKTEKYWVESLIHTLRIDDGDVSFKTIKQKTTLKALLQDIEREYRLVDADEYNKFLQRGLNLIAFE